MYSSAGDRITDANAKNITLSTEACRVQLSKCWVSFLFKTNHNLIQEFQLLRPRVSMATAPLPTLEQALCWGIHPLPGSLPHAPGLGASPGTWGQLALHGWLWRAGPWPDALPQSSPGTENRDGRLPSHLSVHPPLGQPLPPGLWGLCFVGDL